MDVAETQHVVGEADDAGALERYPAQVLREHAGLQRPRPARGRAPRPGLEHALILSDPGATGLGGLRSRERKPEGLVVER